MGSREEISAAIHAAAQTGSSTAEVIEDTAAAFASLAEHATESEPEATERTRETFSIAASTLRSTAMEQPTVRDFDRLPERPRGLAKEWAYDSIALSAVRSALWQSATAGEETDAEGLLDDIVAEESVTHPDHGTWREKEFDYVRALARHYLAAFRVLTGQEARRARG